MTADSLLEASTQTVHTEQEYTIDQAILKSTNRPICINPASIAPSLIHSKPILS